MCTDLGSAQVPEVPCLASEEEEEEAAVWPHAGCGAGGEDDMGRVAP